MPEDLRPPKEWWEHCVSRLQEQGYSEDRARRICGWVFYHHLKPYPPEKEAEAETEKQEETAEDILARIYSKISRGEELTEQERKILAAYLEGVRPAKDEEKEKDITIPASLEDIASSLIAATGLSRIRQMSRDEIVRLLTGSPFNLTESQARKVADLIEQKVKKEISKDVAYHDIERIVENWIKQGKSFTVMDVKIELRRRGKISEEEMNSKALSDKIREVIDLVRNRYEKEEKEISVKELRKMLEEVKKARKKDKPYTREARARKRAWLRATGGVPKSKRRKK